MKHSISLALTTLSIVSMVTFSNCKKEGPSGEASSYGYSRSSSQPANTRAAQSYETSFDRIDEIVKDLAQESYSLSFNKTYPTAGVTRNSYGAESFLGYADPQDLICPEPLRLRQRKVAIFRRPVFIQPTCPKMIWEWSKFEDIKNVLVKADPGQFTDLGGIKLLDGGIVMASQKYAYQYANKQLDKIDAITKDLNPESYLMLNDENDFGGGFTRSFYGYADINARVMRPLRKTIPDIFKPRLKGCFDPIILSIIRERLQRIDPEYYRGLNVTTLPEDKGVATLGF